MDVIASDARHIMLYGGARSGKTFLICLVIVLRALRVGDTRHIIFRSTFAACKQSLALETMPTVFRKCFPGLNYGKMLNKTDWYIRFENGSEVWFGGLESGDRLDKILGREYATIFLNEVSQIPYQSVEQVRSRAAQKSDLAIRIFYDMNPTNKRHWSYIEFFEKRHPLEKRELANPELYSSHRINPKDNVENIDKGFLTEMENASERVRMRFLHGQFLDDSEGALWTIETIAVNRVYARADKPLPDWLRVVVAVDPSGCKGAGDKKSDEIGIVVVALGTDGHLYVLDDLSGKYSPEEWGKVVCDAYDRWQGDRVIGEVNYGGDMVRAVVQSVNPTVPFEDVRASRGKVPRAEPVASLYDQGKVHHVGVFDAMESQMCQMMVGGYVGIGSPDRADALVWGCTALVPKLSQVHVRSLVKTDVPRVLSPDRKASRFSFFRR